MENKEKETKPTPATTTTTTSTTQNTQGDGAGANSLDYDPLRPAVIERESVKQNMGMGSGQQQTMTIPEDNIKSNPLGATESERDKKTTSSSSSSSSSSSTSEKKSEPKVEKPRPVIENPAVSEMSQTEKKREAERIADTLIFHYCLYVPMPFKLWASFNERKIEQLAIEDKIDLNMTFDIGTEFTVKEYIDGINKEVDKAFTVGDDRKEAIKKPLIAVLMKQGMLLSPEQELMFAVGAHIVEMGLTAFKISQQNSKVLEFFTNAHSEKKDSSKQQQQSASQETSSHERQPDNSGGSGGSGGGEEAPANTHTDEHLQHADEVHHNETHQSETSHEGNGGSDNGVTGMDEGTGQEIAVTVIETNGVKEKDKKTIKKGGRPSGTGTAGGKHAKRNKNAISLDEAISSDKNLRIKKEIEKEILGDENGSRKRRGK